MSFRQIHSLFLATLLPCGTSFSESEQSPVQQGNSAPWGELETFPLVLEPPDNYIVTSRDRHAHLRPTTWNLTGHTRESAEALVRDAGLSEEAIRKIMHPPYFRIAGPNVILTPPPDVIKSMTPEIRSRLYPKIGPKNNNNVFHDFYLIDKEGFPAMAEGSGLNQTTIDLISQLTYQRAGTKAFSDIGVVMLRAGNETERWRVLKTLLRERSLSLRIKLSDKSDLVQLASYWSAAGRRKDILPILESVTRTAGVERLDVAHLLPPTPRKLLHTYAHPLMGVGDDLPDCFWTAFNFFAYEPSNRHFDPAAFRQRLADRYVLATPPQQFGDLLVIFDTTAKSALHACSFVAGDIVFTKNGNGLLRPWTLTRLEDVVSFYSRSNKITLASFRLKPGFTE